MNALYPHPHSIYSRPLDHVIGLYDLDGDVLQAGSEAELLALTLRPQPRPIVISCIQPRTEIWAPAGLTLIVRGDAIVHADGGVVYATEQSEVYATSGTHVEAHDSATVHLAGAASCSACDYAEVVASDHSWVDAYDHARVWARDSSLITLSDQATALLSDYSQTWVTGSQEVVLESSAAFAGPVDSASGWPTYVVEMRPSAAPEDRRPLGQA